MDVFFGFETDENRAIVNKTRVICRICDVSISYSRVYISYSRVYTLYSRVYILYSRVYILYSRVYISYSRDTTNLAYHLYTTHKNEYDSIVPETTGQSSSTPVTNQTTLPAIANKMKPYSRVRTLGLCYL